MEISTELSSVTDSSFTVSSYTDVNVSFLLPHLFAHDEQEFGEDSDEAIIKCGKRGTEAPLALLLT